MEVVRLIHSFERQGHSVPQRQSAPEKSSIHLIEAHDWMGPDTRPECAPEPRDVRLPSELTTP
ncbi:MAG: hypothetical protein KF760_02815 [Candidatus Eremiobacteraeota bacterium]|nr:hypothetical protein [Candidatus Eremiobacteraeota bacterium]